LVCAPAGHGDRWLLLPAAVLPGAEFAYAVPVRKGIDSSAEMERDAAAYAGLLAEFRRFTLIRYVHGQQEILELAVYRGDEPGEVGQLRRLLAAHPPRLARRRAPRSRPRRWGCGWISRCAEGNK
jgi:hypothetical protein